MTGPACMGKLYCVYSTPELSEKNFFRWDTASIIRWDTASWCTRYSCEKRYSLFYVRLVITSG